MDIDEAAIKEFSEELNLELNKVELKYKPIIFSDMIEVYKYYLFFNVTRDYDVIDYTLERIAEEVFKLQGIDYKRDAH